MIMITFEKENKRFTYRIGGIAISNGKLLLHRSEEDNFWALPGGRCEFLENSKDALLREMKEEIGVEINIIRPLYFVENFFDYKNQKHHEISILYLIEFPINSDLVYENDIFYGKEQRIGFKDNIMHGKEVKLIFKWFNINDLETIELYPSFLQKSIKEIKPYPEHIIHRDN